MTHLIPQPLSSLAVKMALNLALQVETYEDHLTSLSNGLAEGMGRIGLLEAELRDVNVLLEQSHESYDELTAEYW